MSRLLLKPAHVDEPHEAAAYAKVLSEVASLRQAVIVRREGADLVGVIPLELLALVQEVLATREAEQLASEMDWSSLVKASPPPQSWFEGAEPKPF